MVLGQWVERGVHHVKSLGGVDISNEVTLHY